MKKYPMHGKDAQLRHCSDGKIENENDIVEKESKFSKPSKFKKISEAFKTNKKKSE